MNNKPPYDWYKELTPNRFVIHCSHKKFRQSIIKNGLLPKIGFSYKCNWSEREFGNILPAVFAMNTDNIKEAYLIDNNNPNYDYWLIDTTDTIWYEDANIGYPCIMTFDKLTNIKLI